MLGINKSSHKKIVFPTLLRLTKYFVLIFWEYKLLLLSSPLFDIKRLFLFVKTDWRLLLFYAEIVAPDLFQQCRQQVFNHQRMDLQPQLSHSQNDFIAEVLQITNNHPLQLSRTLYYLLRTTVLSGHYPACYQCNTLLMSKTLGFLRRELYCSSCLEEVLAQHQQPGLSDMSSLKFITVDMGQSLCLDPEWSLWDSVELSVRVGELQKDERVRNETLASLGHSLYNQKRGAQVLSHLQLMHYSCFQHPLLGSFSKKELSAFNNLNIEVDIQDLVLGGVDENQKNFFGRFLSQQQTQLSEIQKIGLILRNSSESEFLRAITLRETQNNLAIFQQIMRVHHNSQCLEDVLKPSEVSKNEITEESTPDHIKGKNSGPDIQGKLKEIDKQFRELKKKKQLQKKKRIHKGW